MRARAPSISCAHYPIRSFSTQKIGPREVRGDGMTRVDKRTLPTTYMSVIMERSEYTYLHAHGDSIADPHTRCSVANMQPSALTTANARTHARTHACAQTTQNTAVTLQRRLGRSINRRVVVVGGGGGASTARAISGCACVGIRARVRTHLAPMGFSRVWLSRPLNIRAEQLKDSWSGSGASACVRARVGACSRGGGRRRRCNIAITFRAPSANPAGLSCSTCTYAGENH
jgi:hypothetical protein